MAKVRNDTPALFYELDADFPQMICSDELLQVLLRNAVESFNQTQYPGALLSLFVGEGIKENLDWRSACKSHLMQIAVHAFDVFVSYIWSSMIARLFCKQHYNQAVIGMCNSMNTAEKNLSIAPHFRQVGSRDAAKVSWLSYVWVETFVFSG